MKRRIFVNFLIFPLLCLLLGSGHRVLSQQLVSNPAVAEAAIPVYPAVAVFTGNQGLVTVVVVVRDDGTVKSVEIRSGPPIFTRLLKSVVSRWKFAPTNKTSEERSVQLSRKPPSPLSNFTSKNRVPALPPNPDKSACLFLHVRADGSMPTTSGALSGKRERTLV